MATPASTLDTAPTSRRAWARRALMWGALLALLIVAQSLLVALTIAYESTRRQDEADALVATQSAEIKRELALAVQALQAPVRVADLVARHPALLRVERRDAQQRVVGSDDAPMQPPLFAHQPRSDFQVEAELACTLARQAAAPTYSRSYFVPIGAGQGLEVIDLCLPVRSEGRDAGSIVATFGLALLLETSSSVRQNPRFEFSFIEGDGTRLARAGSARGAAVFVAERPVDLPGATLQLRVDSREARPQLIPSLNTALVLGLSLALFALVLLLAHDVRRRARAEQGLAEALAFRKAMEDSLVTGLRARDLDGTVRYVNPAFCTMVGFDAEQIIAVGPGADPPYWPPEHAEQYRLRQSRRLDPSRSANDLVSEGAYETVFMRSSGERFPALVYEAPLVDSQGAQTGWMSAVVDASAQRRIEEIARQQQDRLQASARLATMGEMASLISHELNQPLSAIASYATGSLNLLGDGQGNGDSVTDAPTLDMIREALGRIAEQAERAGRVIKSVHDFVRRREQHHETLRCDLLVEGVLPLVRLQARKSGARIEVDMPRPSPRVRGDRTMLEQVLLNLSRNGLQAMEPATPVSDRVLQIRVRQTHAQWVTITIRDHGSGIAPDVAARLYTPFFTTRPEGLGLGLSLCRTVIEQHGGALDFGAPADGGAGTEFRFTLGTPRGVDEALAASPAAA
ncbi:MAG: PAS domain S-box protein [Rubrivivax sp.]|nr:PAS domain S-box protein [Rubrivivax sp.]